MSARQPIAAAQVHALEHLQQKLEAVYRLPAAPAIGPFVSRQCDGKREQVLVREADGALDILVLLPEASLNAVQQPDFGRSWDAYLEAIEGVSHFVLLAHRARAERATTLLELELQAEVDKLALLVEAVEPPERAARTDRHHEGLMDLHERLYERVHFLFPAETESGSRYRLANDLAARLWHSLLRRETHRRVDVLRRFYRASQAEKIRIARAA